MSRTVTALYDTRAEAEAARERLTAAVDVEGRAKIIDNSAMSGDQQEQGSSSFHSVPLSHEDRHAYGEGLRRGGFMLCAEVDGDEDADKIVAILEETSTVDLDGRQDTWKQEGWSPYGGDSNTPMTGSYDRQPTSASGSDRAGNVVDEEHIPIVEEQLVVGKREVSRGGARVRSYVRETPVHEQVNLREEHVSVERRPVDQKLSAGELRSGDTFGEREIEMTETAEEAVVAKEARVREELVIKKTADQRTEQIDDTVRKTEVEIEEGERAGSAFGFKGDSSSAEPRSEFQRSDKDR